MLADHGASVQWFVLKACQRLLQADHLSTMFHLSVSVYGGLPMASAPLHLVQGLERQVLIWTACLGVLWHFDCRKFLGRSRVSWRVRLLDHCSFLVRVAVWCCTLLTQVLVLLYVCWFSVVGANMWGWHDWCGLWFRGVSRLNMVSNVWDTQQLLGALARICHSCVVLHSGWQSSSRLGVSCHLLVVIIVHLLKQILKHLLQFQRVCLVEVVAVLVCW